MTGSRPTRLLIIDDSDIDRSVYCRYLRASEGLSYRIWEASTLEEGINLWRSHAPDAILLDIVLPDGSGLEFLEILGEKYSAGQLPVIILTGQGSEWAAVQAMKLRAADYLVKGDITAASLRFTVEQVCSYHLLSQELADSEYRYASLAAAVPIGILRTDCHGSCTYVNAQWCRIAGLTDDQALGHGWIAAVHPDDRVEMTAEWYLSVKSQLPFQMEYRFRHADGTIVWVYGQSVVEKDPSGSILGYITTVTDITERKKSEDRALQYALELEQSNQEKAHFVKQFADTVPSVLYIYDLYLEHTVYVNKAVTSLLGYLPTDITAAEDSLILTRLHPDDVALYTAHCQRLHTAADDEQFLIEYRIKRADGQWRWFQSRETVYTLSDSGQPKQILGVAEDITDRKEWASALEEKVNQLAQSAQTNEILLKEVHHRVKNNLQVISGLLYLQMNQAKDPQVTHALQNSRDRIQSIALMHEKFYGSQDLARIDLRDYILELTQTLLTAYDCDPNRIQLEIEAEHISLPIDIAVPCGLVINELITNALKYAFPPEQPQGQITVGLHQLPSTSDSTMSTVIELSVKDNGIGMTDPITFNSTEMTKPLSLGLRLVHSLVTKQLRGTVDVGHHQGTHFRIHFKCA